MKHRYDLIGQSLFLAHLLLRYCLASPEDLFSALLASSKAILLSPGRRTCEMLRPARGGQISFNPYFSRGSICILGPCPSRGALVSGIVTLSQYPLNLMT